MTTISVDEAGWRSGFVKRGRGVECYKFRQRRNELGQLGLHFCTTKESVNIVHWNLDTLVTKCQFGLVMRGLPL